MANDPAWVNNCHTVTLYVICLFYGLSEGIFKQQQPKKKKAFLVTVCEKQSNN